MKKSLFSIFIYTIIAITASFSISAYAIEVPAALPASQKPPPPPAGFWQCRAFNDQQQMWFQDAHTQWAAMQGARAQCLHYSDTCQVPMQTCRYQHLGLQFTICRTRDQFGRTWSVRATQDSCQRALQKCQNWHRRARDFHAHCWVMWKYKT